MTYSSTPVLAQKLCSIYSDRREKNISVRIRFSVTESAGCKVYQLQQVEELG